MDGDGLLYHLVIRKIGYDFCKIHADNGTTAYGEDDGFVKSFVGVSDEPAPEYDIDKVDHLILTSGKKWPYYAHCTVAIANGKIEFGEYRSPQESSEKYDD